MLHTGVSVFIGCWQICRQCEERGTDCNWCSVDGWAIRKKFAQCTSWHLFKFYTFIVTLQDPWVSDCEFVASLCYFSLFSVSQLIFLAPLWSSIFLQSLAVGVLAPVVDGYRFYYCLDNSEEPRCRTVSRLERSKCYRGESLAGTHFVYLEELHI